MKYRIAGMEEPRILGMGDVVRYMRHTNYSPARLHEQLIKLVTKPTLHSPKED